MKEGIVAEEKAPVSEEAEAAPASDEAEAAPAGDDEADREDLSTPSPEAALLGREAARVVERALARLSEDRRAALLLRLDHDLAYDDIAAMLGWSLSKAKVEVHRARAVLREVEGDRAREGRGRAGPPERP